VGDAEENNGQGAGYGSGAVEGRWRWRLHGGTTAGKETLDDGGCREGSEARTTYVRRVVAGRQKPTPGRWNDSGEGAR
jgi:hypothetical protein